MIKLDILISTINNNDTIIVVNGFKVPLKDFNFDLKKFIVFRIETYLNTLYLFCCSKKDYSMAVKIWLLI